MRRGQAALEFLTTYGWAFMVILVAIGALSYLGVTNPNQFIPERCVSQGISCVDHEVSESMIRVFVSNDLGQSVSVNTSSLEAIQTSTGVSISSSCAIDGEREDPVSLSVSSRAEITCDIAGSNLAAGSKERFEIRGDYIRTGGRYAQPLSIELIATVREDSDSDGESLF